MKHYFLYFYQNTTQLFKWPLCRGRAERQLIYSMKHLTILTLLLGTLFICQGQAKFDTTGSAHNLTVASNKMVKFFLDKNFAQYVNYIHPKILAMLGGKDSMALFLQKSMVQMKQQGYAITNVTIGTIGTILINSAELQCVVPQVLEIKTTEGRLVSTGYLLGISDDKGKTWSFIDTGGNPLSKIQTMFPNLDNRLVIPPKQQPVLYKN